MAIVVGVDLGGTNMQAAAFDDAGELRARTHRPTDAARGSEAIVDDVAGCVADVCAEAGMTPTDAAGVGVATAGAIDGPHGVVLRAPNLNFTDFPLRDELIARLGRPVVIENDVNAAAWGEYRLGAGRAGDDMLGVWVGTGVGGGLVLGRTLYRGDRFTAGEIGQTVILPDAPEYFRTVEDVSSRTGMSRTIHARRAEFPDTVLPHSGTDEPATIPNHVLKAALDDGDALARSVVDRAAHLLGVAIANWVTVLSLSRVVIGGGVTETLGEPYLDTIRDSFRAAVFPPQLATCDLVMTALADRSGLVGAALLAD